MQAKLLKPVPATPLPAPSMVDSPCGAATLLVLNHVDLVPKLELDPVQTHRQLTVGSLAVEPHLTQLPAIQVHVQLMANFLVGLHTVLVQNHVAQLPRLEHEHVHHHNMVVKPAAEH